MLAEVDKKVLYWCVKLSPISFKSFKVWCYELVFLLISLGISYLLIYSDEYSNLGYYNPKHCMSLSNFILNWTGMFLLIQTLSFAIGKFNLVLFCF